MQSPDPLDRLPDRLKAIALSIREVWQLFKTFGDTLGKALVVGLLAGQGLMELPGKLGRRALLAAGIGGLSPLAEGFGANPLTGSLFLTWAPVAVLPAAVLLLWLLRKSLAILNREGGRDASRRQLERPQPGVDEQLAADARRRIELNAELPLGEDLPALEDTPSCHDVMVDALRRIRARFGNRDIALVLDKATALRGFEVVEVKGGLDPGIKALLELEPVKSRDVDRVLGERLADSQYRFKALEFPVGPRRYLLLAVSGATISEDVLAEISEATVLIMEDYVWEIRGIDPMTGEA